MSATDLIPLQPAVQNYAWGLLPTSNSLVARLHALNTGKPVDVTKPYAELWMGIHPSGPARIANDPDQKTLQQFLTDANLPTLPYLFKVLSVAKPLSIQAHPHKELAVKLHASNPNAYKDDNHKPEMCVALSDFEGMCNFKPVKEIHGHLSEFTHLAKLCGADSTIEALSKATTAESSRSAIRVAFSSLMTADGNMVQKALESTQVIVSSKAISERTSADKLFERLCKFYPGDVGCFSAYLLNFVSIKAGQAFFMAANEPHAYLQGQCMEIMANSDNVVRAGLTPKFKDVDNLIQMLTYNDGAPHIMSGQSLDKYTTVYQPPADEFQLTRYVIPAGIGHELKEAVATGLILCIGGSGWIKKMGEKNGERMPLAPGSVYYIPGGAKLEVTADPSAVDGAPSSDLYFFRAGVNEK